jgi:hypothetical protein
MQFSNTSEPSYEQAPTGNRRSKAIEPRTPARPAGIREEQRGFGQGTEIGRNGADSGEGEDTPRLEFRGGDRAAAAAPSQNREGD